MYISLIEALLSFILNMKAQRRSRLTFLKITIMLQELIDGIVSLLWLVGMMFCLACSDIALVAYVVISLLAYASIKYWKCK